jgi:hypothetical protein
LEFQRSSISGILALSSHYLMPAHRKTTSGTWSWSWLTPVPDQDIPVSREKKMSSKPRIHVVIAITCRSHQSNHDSTVQEQDSTQYRAVISSVSFLQQLQHPALAIGPITAFTNLMQREHRAQPYRARDLKIPTSHVSFGGSPRPVTSCCALTKGRQKNPTREHTLATNLYDMLRLATSCPSCPLLSTSALVHCNSNGQNLALCPIVMVPKFIEVVDAATLAAKQEAARSYSKEEWQQQKPIIDRLYRIDRQSTGFVQKALQERGFHVK